MPVAGRQRRVPVALSRAVALIRSPRPADLPDGWLAPHERAGYEEPAAAVEPVNRLALSVRLLAGAAVGAVVMTLAVPAAEAFAVIPVVPDAGSAASFSAVLPQCAPGQESTPASGSGTPAPLGNLQGLPADAAGGGVFAGVALDAEQVKMAATVIAVGK